MEFGIIFAALVILNAAIFVYYHRRNVRERNAREAATLKKWVNREKWTERYGR